MQIVNLPLEQLREAPWNPNTMTPEIYAKLRESVRKFGVVANLVVRPMGEAYEVISGNQRLQVYRELTMETALCFIVELDDAHARLLAQILNRTHGEDDLGLKAELLQEILSSLDEEEVIALLPETPESLNVLSGLGQADIARHLQVWQQAQEARLHHLTFQLNQEQLTVVKRARRLAQRRSTSQDHNNPNHRGNILYGLCETYLEFVEESQ